MKESLLGHGSFRWHVFLYCCVQSALVGNLVSQATNRLDVIGIKQLNYKTALKIAVFHSKTLLPITSIENAKTTVAAIRETQFVPTDATLLAERLTYGTNPEFMPGCVRGFILSAYQSPRDFEQILAEYREALKDTDWEPSPYHSHDQSDYDIFIMGTQDYFEISEHPLRQDILPVPTLTGSPEESYSIYYLQLSHYDPAILGCRG